MRKHLLATAVILTVATGCDNVAFGGIDVELKPPPTTSRGSATQETDVEVDSAENLAGPILLAGLRNGNRGEFVVVGEVHPGQLHPFPNPDFEGDAARLATLMAPGSAWTLFAEGVRVGSMVADETGVAAGYCGERAIISGVVEFIPPAAGATKLLALPAADAAGRPYDNYRAITHEYDQRVASLTIAGEVIREVGATLPPLGVLDARDHIQAFQLTNVTGMTVAATFMHQDELVVASPRQGAYSLFVMGQQQGELYQDTYSLYRSVEAEGKGAPRYFDHLDWDGDGTDEILLDVLGSDRRWFAALSQRDGSWVRTFQDSCGSGSSSGR